MTPRAAFARDAFGVTSAYWGLCDDGVAQSASFDDVARCCAGSLDRDALIDYLALGFVRDPRRTLLRGVHRIPPGHRLVLGADLPRVERWYQIPRRAYPTQITDGRLVRAFWETFVTAVSTRIESAGRRPLAISLSGGLDSVAIACALTELRGRDAVRAVTFGFADDATDVEPRVARQAARELGIDWEMIDASGDDPLAPAPTRPTLFPLPALTASAARWREVTDGAAVFFGHGGDSMLGADPYFWRSRLGRGELSTAAVELLRTTLIHGLRPGFGTTRFRQRLGRGLRGARAEQHVSDLLATSIAPEAARRLGAQRGPWTARGIDGLTHPWWSWILETISVPRPDARMLFPFFDTELADFCAGVPTAPWLVSKEILRSALRGRVSDSIRLRPKAPLRANPLLHFAPQSIRGAIDEVERAELAQYVDVARFRQRVEAGSCRYTEHSDIARVLALARLKLRTGLS